MRKALKILQKILFWICFVGLFIVTGLTVLLKVYEDDIKQYAIDALNQHLRSKVVVQNIELSLFYDFPSASIAFEKVLVPDAYEKLESADTLFYADQLFFNFNVMDVFSGDYKVKRMSAHRGTLRLKTTDDGQVNYDILKPSEKENNDSVNFSFSLELLTLDQIEFSYQNFAAKQFYEVGINQGLLSGDFSDNQYNLLAEADLDIHQLKSNSFTLLKEKTAQLDLNLAVNTAAQSYTFSKGDLMIEKMPFHIQGFIDSSLIDLSISGNDIGLADMANSMVDESLEDVKAYEGEGTIDFISTIKGERSVTEMPSVEADFSIAEGSVTEPEQQLKIYDVSFKGHYQNKQENRQEELEFKAVKFKMLDSYFNGEAVVTDFAQPLIDTKMKGNLDLMKFQQFFKFKQIEKLGGKVNFNIAAIMQFFDPEYRTEKFQVTKSDGNLLLSNVSYQGTADKLFYRQINGEIILNGENAAAHQLSIKTTNSDLLLNGALKNFIPYIEGSGDLGMVASIESDQLDLNEFLSSSEKSKDDPLSVFELPANLNLNVDVNVNQLRWETHHFQKISGKMLMSDRKVQLNNLKLAAYNGEVSGQLNFDNQLSKGNLISGNMRFDRINIKKLFADWNNFQQQSIMAEHLSGTLSGDIEMMIAFNAYFSLIEDQLFAKSNLMIDSGELNELNAMKEITAYMRSNKALKMLMNKHIDQFEEKLLHLKFSHIDNEITIKNRRITIPKMKIKTNAVDVEMFGWHSFDNEIEYHFSFRFRELKTPVEENEFGIVEDDGLGLVIYLTMFGDLNNPQFALDEDERRVNRKEELAKEKEDMKSILKSELGLFKKDSTIKEIERDNRNEVEFIIYDKEDGREEEEDDNSPEKEEKKKSEQKNKDHSIKLFQKWKEDADKKKDSIQYERIQ
ncbi:MAG: AsmA-like C-terminal region-containing protein [Crocinitomicaceae bacterium]